MRRPDDPWDTIGTPPIYYDREARPISLRQWAELHDDLDYIRVASTYIAMNRVSTVWLGIDHSFGAGPPLIFETMIFNENPTNSSTFVPGRSYHEPWDYQRRYHTLEAAMLGHEKAVGHVERVTGDARTTTPA